MAALSHSPTRSPCGVCAVLAAVSVLCCAALRLTFVGRLEAGPLRTELATEKEGQKAEKEHGADDRFAVVLH